MERLTTGQLSVLRTLRQEPWRIFGGREVLEKIFAMTTEEPLDAQQICEIVGMFEQRGWVKVIRVANHDDEFDFAGVQLTKLGQAEAG